MALGDQGLQAGGAGGIGEVTPGEGQIGGGGTVEVPEAQHLGRRQAFPAAAGPPDQVLQGGPVLRSDGDESFYVHCVEIDDRFVAATPEGVPLEFVVAGLGSRFVALFVDTVVQGVAEAIVVIALVRSIGVSSATRQYVTVGAISLTTFLVAFGYFVLFESLNAGRSPGKAMTGLRVVRTSGGPVALRASLLRNVARLADWLPSFYVLGTVLILATRHHQRLGDLLAGTLVVRGPRTAASRMVAGTPWDDRGQWQQAPAPAERRRRQAGGRGGAPGWAGGGWLPPELAHWDVTGVGEPEVALVQRFLGARAGYAPEAHARLASDLATRLWPVVAGPTAPMDVERFLEAVVAVKSVRR